ncbi:uncharacterized protein [Temnothorax nylanderi]|uniref:uncharacterized protein n=1 Tax=Temnothorax nylanderi TaxID=102681 RepID=UPI003A85002A
MCNVQHKKDEKVRDLKIAAFIASHTSIRDIDHLSNILKSLYPDFKNFQMHRTKCSNLIINVIAPNMLTNLINDIGDMQYSMMVDESTDVSVAKYLCLCIKYFSRTRNRIVTEYLGMIQIEHADANSLYSAVIKYSKDIGLNLSKMIGLGTDGGSNLCGKNHSLYTLLRSENPNLQLVRCICHAMDNSASAAATEFPASVEFLCREVYNWFNNSSLRRSEYKLTWDTMNVSDKSNKNNSQKNFYKFVKLSSTRWLARYNVVRVILEHYLELKTHFSLVVDSEKCYTSRLICQMLQDNSNFLYLTIIKPILYEVNVVNLSFQRENVDLGLAYDDLKDLILLLAGKIIKPLFLKDLNLVIESLDNELAFLPVKDADFGIEYYTALTSINISQESKLEVETRAYKYIKTLCVQLCSRLPTNLAFYKNLKSISPTVCLNQIRSKFKDLPFLKQFVAPDTLGLIENQYNKLLSIDWTKILEEKVLANSYAFWPALYIFKNAGEKFIFRELALFMLKLLSFPSSNAVVERVFSIMNIVKTKIRNRMLLVMLDAILRIRLHFYANNTCCDDFQPTDGMLKDFNYKVVYNLNDVDVEKDVNETEIAIGKVLEDFENVCSL